MVEISLDDSGMNVKEEENADEDWNVRRRCVSGWLEERK